PVSCPPWPGSMTMRLILSPSARVRVREPASVGPEGFAADPCGRTTALVIVDRDVSASGSTALVVVSEGAPLVECLFPWASVETGAEAVPDVLAGAATAALSPESELFDSEPTLPKSILLAMVRPDVRVVAPDCGGADSTVCVVDTLAAPWISITR